MILGTGVDIAEVPRIRESIERFGDRFLNRVFTPGKSSTVKQKPPSSRAMPLASPLKKPA
jgi:holo-[acyl-carrier protein] synthase